MTNQGTGYRQVSVWLIIGLSFIGFTRLEDRAIIGTPGGIATAMAAIPLPDDEDRGVSYSDPPEDSVSLRNASQAPRDRVRRVLRDRDVPAVASRQILNPDGVRGPDLAGVQGATGTNPDVSQAFTPVSDTPVSLASLSPPLARQGTPIFAATGPNGGGGNGGGGNGGGGNGGGGNGGGGNGGGGGGGNGGGGNGGGGNGGGGNGGQTPPVSPIPEPGTWLMLILGLFAIGSALRHRDSELFAQSTKQTN